MFKYALINNQCKTPEYVTSNLGVILDKLRNKYGDFTVTYTHNKPIYLPKVIVHRLEEEFVIWFLEDIFEVCEGDFVRRDIQLHQIRCLLVVEVVDNFGFPHLGLWW